MEERKRTRSKERMEERLKVNRNAAKKHGVLASKAADVPPSMVGGVPRGFFSMEGQGANMVQEVLS